MVLESQSTLGFLLMKFCSYRTSGEVFCSFKQKPWPNSIHRRIQMWGAKCKSRADSRGPQQLLEDWQSPWDAAGQEAAAGQIPQTSAPRAGAGSANLFVAPTGDPGNTNSIKGNGNIENSLATVLQYKQKKSLNIFIRLYFWATSVWGNPNFWMFDWCQWELRGYRESRVLETCSALLNLIFLFLMLLLFC